MSKDDKIDQELLDNIMIEVSKAVKIPKEILYPTLHKNQNSGEE